MTNPPRPQPWQPPQPQWQPPAPAPIQPPTNVAAIIAATSGLLGLLLLPVLFGPIALIAGFVGEHQARKEHRKLGRVAILGLLLGAMCTYLAVQRIGQL